MTSNLVIDGARDAFRRQKLDSHQWEAFYMGFCAALNVKITVPFPEHDKPSEAEKR